MDRWSRERSTHVERPDVDAFLNAVNQVCVQHGMVIEHEDGQGSFIVEKLDEDHDGAWLMDADVGYSLEDK